MVPAHYRHAETPSSCIRERLTDVVFQTRTSKTKLATASGDFFDKLNGHLMFAIMHIE